MRLTGRAFANQAKTPIRVLVDDARKYVTHSYSFPEGRVVVWTWREGEGPSPSVVAGAEAEAILGLRAARQALGIDPADLEAQASFAALTLGQAVDRVGLLAFENNPAAGDPIALGTVLASGPRVMETVLRHALADRQSDLAAASALVLSRVADRDSLTTGKRPLPLLEALSSPDRRVQFAAARALVEMQPRRPFAGSSRVVPTLAWFVADPTAPKAVVIDGNLDRGNRLAAGLRGLGIEVLLTARRRRLPARLVDRRRRSRLRRTDGAPRRLDAAGHPHQSSRRRAHRRPADLHSSPRSRRGRSDPPRVRSSLKAKSSRTTTCFTPRRSSSPPTPKDAPG